jgi:ribonuclease-3 family protein
MLDYRLSTGFEALVGFLFLSGQKNRLRELIRISLTDTDASADLSVNVHTGGFFENHQF